MDDDTRKRVILEALRAQRARRSTRRSSWRAMARDLETPYPNWADVHADKLGQAIDIIDAIIRELEG